MRRVQTRAICALHDSKAFAVSLATARGGFLSEGNLMPVGVASEVAGPAWRARSGLPASHSFCGPVRVWLAVSWCAGDGVRGFAAAGVAGQGPGGSAIFDPLTAGFRGLCRVDECPGRRPGHMVGVRLWKGHFTMEWLFCWLWWGISMFDANNFNNVTFNGAGYWTILDSMTVASTMTINQGTLDTSASSCGGAEPSLSVAGSWLNSGGTFVANSSTVTFTASTTGQKIASNGSSFNHLAITGASVWTLQDALTLNSTMTLTAGALNTGAASNPVSIGGGLSVGAATLAVNNSTFSFTGSAGQKINTTPGQAFTVIVDSNTSSGGVIFNSASRPRNSISTAAHWPPRPRLTLMPALPLRSPI